MTNISRVDQAVLQLRAQLQRLARERAHRSRAPAASGQRPLDSLRQAQSSGSTRDDEFRRRFIRALLAEELGEALANEPEFDRISNEVWRMLDQDAETRLMMDTAISQLGGAAG